MHVSTGLNFWKKELLIYILSTIRRSFQHLFFEITFVLNWNSLLSWLDFMWERVICAFLDLGALYMDNVEGKELWSSKLEEKRVKELTTNILNTWISKKKENSLHQQYTCSFLHDWKMHPLYHWTETGYAFSYLFSTSHVGFP